MKKIIIYLGMFLSIIAIFIFSNNVFSVTKYSISITGDSSVTKGSNINLAINANDISTISNGFSGYSGTITYDTSKLEFVSATNSINGWQIYTSKSNNNVTFLGYDDNPPSNTKNNNSEIFKLKFRVLDNAIIGTTNININNIKGSTSTGTALVADPVSKNILIEDAAITKSSDATLSGLVASGYTISPAFNPSTTVYKLSVANDVTNLNVLATANNTNAHISITGNKSFSVGKNNIIVEVTAEDGTRKIYTIEVTRKSVTSSNTTTTKSSNNNLKAISGISGLNFDPNKTDYSVLLPNEITSLEVSAVAEDSKAKVSISNGTLKNLTVGQVNTIIISVTAEDSSIKIYTINVKRSDITSETGLKELVVNSEDLLTGNGDTDKYKITVSGDVNKLDISAIPIAKDSTVTIKGNKNLKEGNNKVVVEVTDKNGFTKSYTIDVEKKSKNNILQIFKDYWFYLLLIIPLIILIILIYLNRKKKKLIDELETGKNKPIIYSPKIIDSIDNEQDILYNSDGNVMIDNHTPVRNNPLVQESEIDAILNDNSVSEIQKEIKVIKDELVGNEKFEKEYVVTEKLRKK